MGPSEEPSAAAMLGSRPAGQQGKKKKIQKAPMQSTTTGGTRKKKKKKKENHTGPGEEPSAAATTESLPVGQQGKKKKKSQKPPIQSAKTDWHTGGRRKKKSHTKQHIAVGPSDEPSAAVTTTSPQTCQQSEKVKITPTQARDILKAEVLKLFTFPGRNIKITQLWRAGRSATQQTKLYWEQEMMGRRAIQKASGSHKGHKKELRMDRTTTQNYGWQPPMIHAILRLKERGKGSIPRFVNGTNKTIVATFVPSTEGRSNYIEWKKSKASRHRRIRIKEKEQEHMAILRHKSETRAKKLTIQILIRITRARKTGFYRKQFRPIAPKWWGRLAAVGPKHKNPKNDGATNGIDNTSRVKAQIAPTLAFCCSEVRTYGIMHAKTLARVKKKRNEKFTELLVQKFSTSSKPTSLDQRETSIPTAKDPEWLRLLEQRT